jgi:hypothetical protein
MPKLTPPDQATIDSWNIVELGVRDGSSPTVSFDINGSTATREVLCNWVDRYKVARWFVGQVSSYTMSGSTFISRLLPQQLPVPDPDEVSPEWPPFHATKIIRITGHQWSDFDIAEADAEMDDSYRFAGSTVNRFTCAKLEVQYERLPYEFDTDDGTTSEIERYTQFMTEESTVDYLTVPASCQKFISATGTGTGHLVPVPYGVGLTETTYRFTLRWHRIPFDQYGTGTTLWKRIFGDGTTANLPYLNAVNRTQFYDTFPPGTCMLEKVTERLDPTLLDGNTTIFTWTLDYHFAVRPYGWNTSWFFPNTEEFAAAGNVAVRMFVGRGNTYNAPGTVPDLYSNYIERDLLELWNTGP